VPNSVVVSAKPNVTAELMIVEEYAVPGVIEFAKACPAARPNGIIALLNTASRPVGSKDDCEPK
jgi:hypothetical protein